MLVDKQKFIDLLEGGHTDQALLQLIDITQFLGVPDLHERAKEQMALFQEAGSASVDKPILSEIHTAAFQIIEELPTDFGGGSTKASGEKKSFWKKLIGG